jgi:16S rRNA G966 N2-methylase RsmD
MNFDTLSGIGDSADSGNTMNRLYYGDNLTVLRGVFDDESVNLIYLDPPFNSQASYSCKSLQFGNCSMERSRISRSLNRHSRRPQRSRKGSRADYPSKPSLHGALGRELEREGVARLG